jgi:hypothetical protein
MDAYTCNAWGFIHPAFGWQMDLCSDFTIPFFQASYHNAIYAYINTYIPAFILIRVRWVHTQIFISPSQIRLITFHCLLSSFHRKWSKEICIVESYRRLISTINLGPQEKPVVTQVSKKFTCFPEKAVVNCGIQKLTTSSNPETD